MGHERREDPKEGGGYRHPDPVTDEALDWFMRLQEDTDAGTIAEFENWQRGDPRRVEAFERLARMHAMPVLRKATLMDAERLGVRTDYPVPPRHHRRWVPAVSAIAAVLLIVVAWHQYPALVLHLQSDYLTATGERETIQLPDGSSVMLNTASAIAIDFGGSRRRVTLLNGEAFFDVRHDEARPFAVAAHFSEVEVKGTAFGVRTDSAEDVVLLERGSVEVSGTGQGAEFAVLAPGQMIVATAAGLSAVREADPSRSLAWREGRIVFHDRPFRNALSDLRRYYRGSVMVVTDGFADRTVSGNYRIDDPEAAIRTLAASVGASVTRLPGGILILR
ncbi:FecR family protein [Pseudochelatococcus sp. B33]